MKKILLALGFTIFSINASSDLFFNGNDLMTYYKLQQKGMTERRSLFAALLSESLMHRTTKALASQRR